MSDLYSVVFTSKARRQATKLPPEVQQQIADRLGEVQENPFDPRFKKLTNERGVRRVRVGNYRVLYSADPELRRVFVEAIGHRRDIYRDL